MKEDITRSLLHSRYVIDGVPMQSTPYAMLCSMSDNGTPVPTLNTDGQLVDESIDPGIPTGTYDSSREKEYVGEVMSSDGIIPIPYSSTNSVLALVSALIDTIWRAGHFRLQDLSLDACWNWNLGNVGAAAAFYESVQSTCEYLDSLDLRFRNVDVLEGPCSLRFSSVLSQEIDENDVPLSLLSSLACPTSLIADSQSWIIYIPFDTASFRLGGSLLSRKSAVAGGKGLSLEDPDYFIDSYEVVRELVEDGVAVCGVSVGEGGLAAALKKMTSKGVGASICIDDISRAYAGSDRMRILFSELPGVLIQIKDSDFDYIDAEFLLQDVAYYPLGHPTPGKGDLEIFSGARRGIESILDSLMRSGTGAEGED